MKNKRIVGILLCIILLMGTSTPIVGAMNNTDENIEFEFAGFMAGKVSKKSAYMGIIAYEIESLLIIGFSSSGWGWHVEPVFVCRILESGEIHVPILFLGIRAKQFICGFGEFY